MLIMFSKWNHQGPILNCLSVANNFDKTVLSLLFKQSSSFILDGLEHTDIIEA